MQNQRNITFTQHDRASLQSSAENEPTVNFLNLMLEDLSPGFFTSEGDITLAVTLNISALHLLFQVNKRLNFGDDSGIVDHILFEFGMQQTSDMQEAITEHVNSIPLNGAEQLTVAFLHFGEGSERSAVDKYLISSYPS